MIVGGGLAGLATAAALVDRGLRITLLESRPRLGGRASSFTDPATGEPVDNCQHVSMACCTNLDDFCRRVGTADLFRRESPRSSSSTSGAGPRALKAGPLPAPLHLTGSFLRARYLTFAEKLRVGLRPGLPPARAAATGPASRSPTGSAATARPTGRSTASGAPCSSRR